MSKSNPLRPGHLPVVLVGISVVAIAIGVLWRQAGRDATALADAQQQASPEQTASQWAAALRREGKDLRPVATGIPEGRAGLTITLGRADLATHQLHLRSTSDDRRWLYVDGDGQVHNGGGLLGAVNKTVELLLTPSGLTAFVDDRPLVTETSLWEAQWVVLPDAGPPPKARAIPQVAVRDDFMREELEPHPYARVTAGTVALAQHGGGMAKTVDQEADPSFQRAVNPFSVHASDGGQLTYNVHTPARWGDAHAEACFYFGVPKTGHIIDRATLPTGTDMMLAMGPDGGLQIAFGWSGSAGCFVLRSRSGSAPWRVLERWQEKRPPLTNWVKIALECRRGYQVVGLLDDVPVLSADLPGRLRGPFHVLGGKGLVEFDDVRAWSLPTPAAKAASLLVRSRQFAGKDRKGKADPEEFDEWASSSHAFKRVSWRDAASGIPQAAIVTGAGIIGDFVCESPAKPLASVLPGVIHRIGLYAARTDRPVDPRTDQPAWVIQAVRTENGWSVRKRAGEFAGPDSDQPVPELVVARRADSGNRMCLRVSGRWLPLSDPLPGPVYLAIVRTVDPRSGRRFLLAPKPKDHVVHCANLVHELFEDAPSAWSWVDGAFRMDCRWACQNQWNFMACGSTGLPRMTSKRVFTGDQVHDSFMCFRATFPWDAGDATFQYDSDADRANGFARLKAAGAWYNRHDLNVSFCSDGRDPLSGYCVIFGGEGNQVTRLLRRGVVVAESRRLEHLIPKGDSFMIVHYPWWHLTLRKTGARVQILLDGEPMFDYTDPEPIAGGHIGFWSVRNGFAISRVSSMAEEITWDAHVSYVSNSTEGSWTPLVQDAVHLTTAAKTRLTQVTNTFGGGFFAVRHVPPQPIDLRQTPRLELPLRLGPGVRVSLHLEIGGKPFMVRVGDSPLTGIKAFLVPGSEKGECFQLQPLPEFAVRARHCLAEIPSPEGVLQLDLLAALRKLAGEGVEPVLTCLTVGNSSNSGYLMAGNGANVAGSTYSIGPPRFSK